MIDPDALRTINAAFPRLTLDEARMRELPIELQQLKAAIEAVARPPAFHAEPADFRVALRALATDA